MKYRIIHLSNRAKIADLKTILYYEYYYFIRQAVFSPMLFYSTPEFFRAVEYSNFIARKQILFFE